ncbi:hypothetical protein CALCODRAFT_438495 [Calocera cornea HHB12733]|uniref:Uncharacterized protein n=1 Tax=Calocera cornea HHB12733 TaxID=1353952 RepID=A0A165EBN8_9BASI|nr:hypothetical protein CALCODRAFT_438495 [Calocera cornea HHB12733]
MSIYRLITVNTFPERAKLIIGRIAGELKGTYEIEHAGNVERIEDVQSVVTKVQPDLLFVASMWTPEQAQEILAIAKGAKPDLRTLSMPQGLQAEKGPDGVVAYVKEKLPSVLA